MYRNRARARGRRDDCCWAGPHIMPARWRKKMCRDLVIGILPPAVGAKVLFCMRRPSYSILFLPAVDYMYWLIYLWWFDHRAPPSSFCTGKWPAPDVSFSAEFFFSFFLCCFFACFLRWLNFSLHSTLICFAASAVSFSSALSFWQCGMQHTYSIEKRKKSNLRPSFHPFL